MVHWPWFKYQLLLHEVQFRPWLNPRGVRSPKAVRSTTIIGQIGYGPERARYDSELEVVLFDQRGNDLRTLRVHVVANQSWNCGFKSGSDHFIGTATTYTCSHLYLDQSENNLAC